ncbi:MAG: stage II sporulation protein M [Planctomycetes bacterium]|nr:stage II sporulation protein M [Planctomycetota bacterium]
MDETKSYLRRTSADERIYFKMTERTSSDVSEEKAASSKAFDGGPFGADSADREQIWNRLRELVDRAEGRGSGRPLVRRNPATGRGIARFDAEEIADLGRLYRAATTHLARAQTFGSSRRRLENLNRLVARAHALVYGRPVRRKSLKVIFGSFVLFPIVVRATIWFHVAAAFLLALGGLYGYFGALEDPEWTLKFVASGDSRTPYADREELLGTLRLGRDEGTEVAPGFKTAFATYLWLHNSKVALMSFFSGVLFGLPTVFLLFYNGAMLGVYTATFHRHDLAYEWWAWIMPHGVTELLAVVLLSGGGLFVGYTLLVPGTRSRQDALWAVRGTVLQMVMFVFPMLLAAGVIESFVRQSHLSDPGRYVFATASAVFWACYLGLTGRSGVVRRANESTETLAEARVPLPEMEDFAVLQTRVRASR